MNSIRWFGYGNYEEIGWEFCILSIYSKSILENFQYFNITRPSKARKLTINNMIHKSFDTLVKWYNLPYNHLHISSLKKKMV